MQIQYIKYKRVYKNIIILGVSDSELNFFDCIINEKISVVIWNEIVGYQLDGDRISEEEEYKYCSEIEKFYISLNDRRRELININLVLYYIDDIYDVTPSRFAGKLL